MNVDIRAMFSMWDELWRLLPSVPLLAALPPILHFLDKLLDRVHIISHATLYSRIQNDKREHVANALKTEDIFKSVSTYFKFDRDAHFIISIMIFASISLVVFAIESKSYIVAICGVALCVGFAVVFAFRVASSKFPMSAIDPTRKWRRSALAVCCVVIAVELYGHFSLAH